MSYKSRFAPQAAGARLGTAGKGRCGHGTPTVVYIERIRRTFSVILHTEWGLNSIKFISASAAHGWEREGRVHIACR